MYRRSWHNLIGIALNGLDSSLLADAQCYFGGGTAIALKYGEFRQSVDIDFLVCDRDGYRRLRDIVKAKGLAGLFLQPDSQLIGFSSAKIDSYGIRGFLNLFGESIKFEIVFEGRIKLEVPSFDEAIQTVLPLTRLDLAVEKLLANSDGHLDESVFGRDAIDLSMMQLSKQELASAMSKAKAAYGETVKRDLLRAIEKLQAENDWLDRCRTQLSIDMPKALLYSHLGTLAKNLA